MSEGTDVWSAARMNEDVLTGTSSSQTKAATSGRARPHSVISAREDRSRLHRSVAVRVVERPNLQGDAAIIAVSDFGECGTGLHLSIPAEALRRMAGEYVE